MAHTQDPQEPMMSDVIPQGLTNDMTDLARFGRHPDPAIDFCIQVETLESRLHQAMNSLCKPGDEPETVENVLVAIEQAMDFRVGGDEGAVNAKAVLRDLEKQARAALVSAPAVPDDVADGLADYDAGLLNDFGGGDVDWWQDYLRAEIGRANDFWRVQAEAQAAELAQTKADKDAWIEQYRNVQKLEKAHRELRERAEAENARLNSMLKDHGIADA